MLQLTNASTRSGREVKFLGSAGVGILHAYISEKNELRILFTNKAVERSWFYASTKLCRSTWHRARKITKLDISYEQWKNEFAKVEDKYDACSVLAQKGFLLHGVGSNIYVYKKDEYAYCQLVRDVLPKNNLTEIDGTLVPTDRLDEFTFICDVCGERHMNDQRLLVHTSANADISVAKCMCKTCASNLAFRCDDCRQYFLNELRCIEGNHMCQHCRDNYFVCDECGCIERRDRGAEVNGQHLCEDCLCSKYRRIVRGYHDNPELCVHVMHDEDTDCYVGTEVETEGLNGTKAEYYKRIEVTKRHGEDERLIYQMHDGSLNTYGIECITQPMSKRFFDQFNFEGWFEELRDAGAMATRNTGLHVHLSREWMGVERGEAQDIMVGRMRQFLSENQSLVERFARRSESHWSAFKKSFNIKPSSKEERVECHKKNAKSSGRYYSVNNENYSTIEFRIFAGTMDPLVYRASVEFCLRVVDYIKTHEENTETWQEFITYKPLPESMKAYMQSRGMTTEYVNQ